jgi:hypothetical protein
MGEPLLYEHFDRIVELCRHYGMRLNLTTNGTFPKRGVRKWADVIVPVGSDVKISFNGATTGTQELWVHFHELRDQDLRRSPESMARWNETAAQCRSVAAEHLRPNGTRVRLEHFSDLAYHNQPTAPVESECPFLGREAWINHAGRFDPCCAPDDRRQTLGSFGLVQAAGFLKIWNGPAYRSLVADYKNRTLCQGCLMRKGLKGNPS